MVILQGRSPALRSVGRQAPGGRFARGVGRVGSSAGCPRRALGIGPRKGEGSREDLMRRLPKKCEMQGVYTVHHLNSSSCLTQADLGGKTSPRRTRSYWVEAIAIRLEAITRKEQQATSNKKLLGAPGIATNGARTLLGAPGRTTRSKKLQISNKPSCQLFRIF